LALHVLEIDKLRDIVAGEDVMAHNSPRVVEADVVWGPGNSSKELLLVHLTQVYSKFSVDGK
jgi:hypothetical protein